MPVLPEVGSTITPPGLSLPERSADSTIASAMRALIDAAGLTRSCVIQTPARAQNSRLMRTCGVLPMVLRMLAAFMPQGLLQWGPRQIGRAGAFCKPSGATRDDRRLFGRRLVRQIERSGPAKLGEPERPEQGDGNRGDPASHCRGDRAQP